MTTDNLTAALDEIRANHQQHVSMNFPEPGICVSRDGSWPCDSGRLLAALDEVLNLADDLDAPPASTSSAVEEDRMWIRQECATDFRAAIFRALLGEEGDE